MVYVPNPPPPTSTTIAPQSGTFPTYEPSAAQPEGDLLPAHTPPPGGDVPTSWPGYTPAPVPGTAVTDDISGASVPYVAWDSNTGRGIGAATLAALKNA